MPDMTKSQKAYAKYLSSMREIGRKVGVSWTIDAEICERLLEIEVAQGKHPSLFVGDVLREKLGLPPKEIPNADK